MKIGKVVRYKYIEGRPVAQLFVNGKEALLFTQRPFLLYDRGVAVFVGPAAAEFGPLSVAGDPDQGVSDRIIPEGATMDPALVWVAEDYTREVQADTFEPKMLKYSALAEIE